MSDFNKKFLIKASECHLGVSISEENWDKDILGLNDVNDFFSKAEIITLYAIIEQEQERKKLKFITQPPESQKLVVFSKTKPTILTEDNLIGSIQITSICGPPSLALYNTLNNVFTPFLAQEKSSIQRHIANLQADLRSDILSSITNLSEINESSLNSLTIVESLEHETEYWNNIARSSKSSRLTRTTAASFRDILKTISHEFNLIEALPLNEVEDLLENAHGILDDLWRHEPPYPKERIIHLMDLIANNVNSCISKQLKDSDIWGDNYNTIAELLRQCISVGNKWIATCRQLTEIFWPNYSANLWKDPPYEPQDLVKLIERLHEILNVQTLLRQLTRLLSPQEQETLKTNEMFRPFKDLNILEFGQYSDNLWLKACKQFEYLLEPAEERVASKLKTQLSNINSNTRQLLHEFSRYSELIARPILKQTLLSERQQLLASLYDYIRQLQSELTSDNNQRVVTKYETPQIISEVIIIKQLEAKANEVLKTSQKLLSDLQGFENLHSIVSELIKDLKQQHTELFDSWTREISTLIKNDVLNLKESDPVVQFSTNKLMKVNYSPRLVTLITEVRQFKAQGYHVPSNIEQTSEHAKKFMTLARILEQIANFHNTIGNRMITCQRPMMLASALELSRLVQEEKVVSWGDTKSVEKYVETLKNAVEKLSKENNLLASYYYQIMDKIKSLDDVDLIKDYSKWKETTRQIRNIMSQVEEKGFRNMQAWKADVDLNLCKVLEKQYIRSLDSLHLYLPEIYTDIIYRNSKLQFSPDEEALKEKYQQQLKKFLDIPKTFRGVLEDPDKNIFAEIIDNNKEELDKVAKHTEDLFEQLHSVLKHWQSWLQLDSLDVSKLKLWQHWDLHFRASKTFGQEIAKLPSNEERVGCFLIGLSRLRSDLEAHNRSYWDQLVLSLKDSIAEDVVKLQNYVDPSTALLTRQPVTLEEVGESGAAHANILKQEPEMQECFDQMLQKAQILASWTRETVDSVNRLKGAWERLLSLLENHQHIIAKQMETIKTTLNIESENLEKEIERFLAKWEQIKPKQNTGRILEQSISELHQQRSAIKDKNKQWVQIIEKKDKILGDYDKFSLEKPQFEMIKEVEDELNKEEDSWQLFDQFFNEFNDLINEEWIVFRKKIYRFEDFLTSWQTKLKNEKNTDIITRILQEIHKYEEVMPSLKFVRGEDFTEKHWVDVFNLLQMPPKSLDLLIFKDFLDYSEQIISHTKEIQAICKKAASEIVVRQALAELDQWDVQARFTMTPHVNSHKKTIMLIKDFKDILSKIGDNQSLLQSVKNSADYESFSERAGLWENKLATLDQNLTLLSQIQRKWVYLEPIFGGGTLIQEKARFEKTDKDFQHVLIYIEKDTRVSALTRYPNLSILLNNLQDQLARCQRSLDNFLLEKRNKFPRFLFLGDDDLLEVVGQSSKEQVIQTHLKKLFAGINSIQLNNDGKNINSICSLQGETVQLINSVNINKPVEEWLNDLVKEMQKTLKELLIQCLAEGQAADPLKYPSQILCLADNITFTLKTEQAISNMTLPPLLAYYKAQLTHYSSLELSAGEESSFASISASIEDENTVLELKLKALLLDTIHHISILEELLDLNVTKPQDWTWQKQLRFYSNSLGEVTIKMANARMDYAYEYQGNGQKLVRTPLTDRCFLTLTQGMHLGMGGNPYGPAGTGKTESVKALGALLGRQVLVFNCDEGLDAASMGRILSGLVRSGAWGCFDEFNRLDEATLSAVSMQIQPIQTALRTHKEKLLLLEQEIDVNKHCGIFVTLNPAGGNYGGRNKLPDNLKQLFRPVVMTHPDHEQIAKTLLHCDGYQNADLIGKKIIEVFDSASKLLSRQQHYDWGLRAIKTVLNGCGRALKQHRKRTEEAEGNQLLIELTLTVEVLRMDTLSKLTFTDSLKFDGLLQNIFKDIQIHPSANDNLVKALEESCEDLKLTVNQRQIRKCLELYEQLKQRMGVAIVGPPSSGKSTIKSLLFNALTKTGKQLKQYVFNPKSMQKTELLGQIDLDTRQWSDGVLTLYSLQVVNGPSDLWSWIVCDGNVDPEWVESLNSVLDDNRLLSLPSGWRIQFGPNVNFVFETHDLSRASPATISRMGVVFLSEEDLHISDYITNFVKYQSEDYGRLLGGLISDYYIKAIDWIFNEAEITLATSKIGVAKTGLSQLFNAKTKAQFSVALVNGLGQQLAFDFREIFAQQVYEWVGEVPPPIILRSRYNQERDMIDTYYTNPNISLELTGRKIPLVVTGEIAQILDCLRVWLLPGNEQHFLLVGPHGSAKTLILEYLVKERSDLDLAVINCSSKLTPNYLINKISQLCIVVNTNKGKVYKPKRGNLVLYIKNLHLLKPDKWGSNIIIEFLHQMITYKGFFDSNLELVGYENITIVGSLIVTPNLPSRLTSIIHIFNINPPDPEDLTVIIVSYLTALIKECYSTWPKAKIVKLAATMIAVYDKIRNTFVQSDFKHYEFSPHDLTNWCGNIRRYKDILQSDESMLEIIYYEAIKLFGDRLVNSEDNSRLENILNEAFKSQWNAQNLNKTITNCFYVQSPQYSSNTDNINLIKLNGDEWKSMIEKGIQQYSRDGQNLDVLINSELLDICASISKVLSAPEGHVILAGRAGIGRKSSVKIISALQSSKIIAPVSGIPALFNIDQKSAMQLAGVEGEHVYLLLEDYIFKNQDNLSLVNNLISAGEIPGLFNIAELDSMSAGLKDEASRENFEANLAEFFIERVKRRLHVIVCLDIDNENIYNIFDNCPAFLHKSTIIWKSEWNNETIKEIALSLIKTLNATNNDEIEYCNNFPKIYSIVRDKIAAPFRYVSMIKLYSAIYREKKSSITSRQNKLTAGVSKLNEAANLVSDLKEKASKQEEKLAEKQAKANAALDMISSTMRSANSHKEEMVVLKKRTEQENQQLMIRKKEIEAELAEVEPLIQEARSAVGNIKPEALSEIRSLRAPPDVIRDILEGVLRLMGIQDTSWNSMKTFLAKRGVKEEIRSFDASRITSENRAAVEKLINAKGDSFDPKSAKRASVAAAPLAAWVAANVKYSHVADKIRPLEREQNKLKENLANAEAQLGELSAGLSDVDASVAQLKLQLSAYTKEAAEIEIDLNKAQATLSAAEGLVSKLDDEYKRWQEQLKELSKQLQELSDNSCLAAAFITYLSDESEDGRSAILNKWVKEIGVEFNFEEFLSMERDHLQWQTEGLPYDTLSIQNAIIILNTKITPLLIDPTSNAVNWFKTHFKNRQIESVAQNSPKFNTNLELSVRFGKMLIIEEIDDISSILLPLLRAEFILQGERKLVNLNGKLIDYHGDFALILSSRNEHLKLTADVAALISAMNFTVTHTGLTEQLLSSAIKQENPKLEDRRKHLLKEREDLQEKQHQLQNQLLEDLANSSTDILQNASLLASLNETKASSTAIMQALEESSDIQAKLQEEYKVYQEISIFGSRLYFACNEFSKHNILYALSVPDFVKLFLSSLQTFQGLDSTPESQKKHLLHTIYNYVSRGIFKADRLTFGLHLCQKLFSIPQIQWNLLLGNVIVNRNEQDNLPAWIPKQSQNNLLNLQNNLPELYQSLQFDQQTFWKNFMNSDNCLKDFPTHCKVSEFEKLIVVQALRPDRSYTAMTQCVLHLTGLRSIDPPIFDLHQILRESTNYEPILILTVSGTDPSQEIRELAQNVSSEYEEVAMGEGQESVAISYLLKSSQNGTWLILKNLHLVTEWLSILSQTLRSIKPHDKFRLWLLTEPHSRFNFVLAQNSFKIVYEAPQGIKNNLQRTFNAYGDKYFERLTANSARIFFVLSCIHAILQERRNYIPQGWSKWYEFSDTDLATCVKLVEDLWQNNSPQVQWKFISGLCSNAIYGGRIENYHDMGILLAYLRQYLVDEVLSHRWAPFGLKLSLPATAKFRDYVEILRQFPEHDSPAYFGLPENIDRAWQKRIASEIIANLKSMIIAKQISTKFDREIWQKSLTPFIVLWRKLNQGYDFVRIQLQPPVSSDSPIATFIAEEFYSVIKLIQQIHKNFSILNKICRGSHASEDDDINIGSCLINYQVPKLWLTYWEGPKDPNRYLRSLISKASKLVEWKDEKYENIIQKPINLSSLLHPNAFIASFKQEYSKLYDIPMEQLELESNWKPPQHKNYIILEELLIEGALFENNQLKPCFAHSENINTVPNCYITWKEKKSIVKEDRLIEVPLFASSNREMQLTSLQIFSDKRDRDNWIQAGIAFYLEY